MAKQLTTAEIMSGFQDAAQSMRLYRRAEILDNQLGESLIDDLYVDPLPLDQILNTVLRPNTTFVIGRKGTGKSTIFQKLQSELRKLNGRTSAYLDIKTIYESAQVDPLTLAKVEAQADGMSRNDLERLLLHREFVSAVIKEIKAELQKRVDASLWERVKETFSGNIGELFVELDELLDDLSADSFVGALAVRRQVTESKSGRSEETSSGAAVSAEIGVSSKVGASGNVSAKQIDNNSVDTSYSDLLIRTFNITEILSQLKTILNRLKIRHLYVLIDDFSELPKEAMKVAVDVLLAPLNNWSDEFIKFKIAAYPGRIYYGQIDKTKIDEIYLDIFKLYGSSDVAKMEESAIDFTRRLVSRRLEHYCNGQLDLSHYFEESSSSEIWRSLFYASMANPRILGYVLYYLHESHLIKGRKIGVRAIQEASQRYYDEKIEAYFSIGKFLHETFEERSSVFSLKELLELIVKRAKELRSHQSEVIKKISGRPPTSHFHVLTQYESLLSTLELNFFVTKYYEMSDRDGRRVTIYALNYGLCNEYTIAFGRPQGEREFRLYFVERFFDYTSLLTRYLAENQEITCEKCHYKFPFEDLDALRMYKMKCPECSNGVVKVSNLSRKYENELRSVDEGLLLPATELGILQTLHTEKAALRPGAIAAELDCSYQLVGRRGKNLEERDLVDRERNPQGYRLLKITDGAEKIYFSDLSIEELDVGDD